MNLPNLPLEGPADGNEIEFRWAGMHGVSAIVFDPDGFRIDEFRRHTFQEAYDAVRHEYPHATWDGLDTPDEEEAP